MRHHRCLYALAHKQPDVLANDRGSSGLMLDKVIDAENLRAVIARKRGARRRGEQREQACEDSHNYRYSRHGTLLSIGVCLVSVGWPSVASVHPPLPVRWDQVERRVRVAAC